MGDLIRFWYVRREIRESFLEKATGTLGPKHDVQLRQMGSERST